MGKAQMNGWVPFPPFLAITAGIYSKGSISTVMQTGIREAPTKSLVPSPLWAPDAASLILVPCTAATHTTELCRKSCPRMKKRWRDEQDRADLWMDKRFFLGPAVWVWAEQLPEPECPSPPASPALLLSSWSVDTFLKNHWAKFVPREWKLSHLSSPSGDAEASVVRTEAGQNASHPLTVRAVPREIPKQRAGAE